MVDAARRRGRVSAWALLALGGTAPLTAMDTAQAAPPGVGTPAPLPTDDGRGDTPWGPGRQRSGEHFRSVARLLKPGAFRATGDDWSLGITLQLIERTEARWDRDFNLDRGDDSLGIDQRARLGLQAAWADRFGILLEFQDVRPWGAEGTTARTVPLTGMHQAFADLWICPGFEVRVGRQELAYGEERLLGGLDWSQHGRAFDGAFGRISPDTRLTIDLFGLRLAEQVQPKGEPVRITGAWMTGVYGRWRPGAFDLDLYTLYINDPDARTQPRPSQTLLTVGARGVGRLGGLTVTGEAVGQYGRTRANDAADPQTVQAFAAALRAVYAFDAKIRPYLGAEVTHASGGQGDDGTDHTFRQLFPTGHGHLGYADLVGWQNVQAIKASGGLHPLGMHLWLDVWHFRKASRDDAWYDASGTVFQPRRVGSGPGTGRDLGNEVDLSLTIPLHEAAALALGYALFLPGGAALGDDPSHWAFGSLRTQF